MTRLPFVSRRAGFGLIVLEYPRPQTLQWVDLSQPAIAAADVTELFGVQLAAGTFQWHQFAAPRAQAPPAADPDTPAELRCQLELDAARSPQPAEWMNVYRSVSGLRWRCCQNRFEDEHTPWCPLVEGDHTVGRGPFG